MTDLTTGDINNAFAIMQSAEETLAITINEHATNKKLLAVNKAVHIAEGLEGSNQALRDADLESKTEDQRDAVYLTAERLVMAKLGHAVAKAEVDRVKYTIRYMEIAHHAASNV